MKLKLLLTLVVTIPLLAPFSISAQLGQQQTSATPQPSPTPPPRTVALPSPSPQQSSQPGDEDVVRITTNLVQVDAVVTDRSGKQVTDLKPEEIRILEDGRPQAVTNFSYIVAESGKPALPARSEVVDKTAPPVPPVTLRPEQVRRTIALVVDDLGLSFESTHFVRRALKKFVDDQMQAGDLVAIIRTSGGIGALQQFTSDKRQLYAAIERVRWYASGRSGISAFAPIEDRSDQSEEMQAANDEQNQFREDVFAVGTLGAVGYVVRGLKQLPGRKSILLISDGFRIYGRNDPARYQRTLEALRRLIDQAGRASVVIYTMNASGLQTLMLSAADNTGMMSPEQIEQQLGDRRTAAFESPEGLNYLAHETGGLAFRNNNDLTAGIKRVIDDQKGYYLIGYRPDESTFDPRTGRRTFHKLSLKILRPGKFSVRTRNGFLGFAEEEAKATLPTARDQILSALFSPFGTAGVHVRLTSLFANDAKLGSLTRSMLHVNAGDLTFTDEPDGWHKATFDVLAVTFGDNGTVVDQASRTHTLRVKGQSYKQMLKEGFVYFITFPIKKAGAYQLRAVLRDHGSQRVGSASQFIEVPDIKKKRLVLSSIVLAGKDLGKKQTDGTASTANDAAAPGDYPDGEETTNSAAVRQFHTGAIINYGVVVYNASLAKNAGPPQVQIQVRIFREGKPVFVGKEQTLRLNEASDLKRLAASGALQLGSDMVPGEYVFQVIATDLLADPKRRVTTQWIDFEMIK